MTNLTTRLARLELLLAKIEPVPQEWKTEGKASNAAARSPNEMECAPCSSWAVLVNSWRKAVKWFDGADQGLSTMLAVAFSTEFVGEQLWFKIIAPPASLKTTLLEGLAVCSNYIYSKDSIRGLHDGWKDDDGEDKSLLALCRGKTLAIKDGDTLLKAPDLPRILSEFRGAYDRVSRTHYRNHKIADYVGHRMTVLICGTSALREIDDSELGTRFLDCVLMDRIDDDFEDEVGMRSVYQESRNMRILSDGRPESQHPAELSEAMALTGGYVRWLRENAHLLSDEIVISDAALAKIAALGKFIAFMRTRPPKKGQEELSDREFSARINKQLVRLAVSYAAVINHKGVDEEVLRRVWMRAMDTSRGATLEIVRALDDLGPEGAPAGSLGVKTNQSEDRMKTFLRFLAHHEIVEIVESVTKHHGLSHQTRWVLTGKMRNMYKKVTG